jgi:hypothetical protein
VRYKLKTATSWATARTADRRTGSGNVVVSGLTNESAYQFTAYNYVAGYTPPQESEWLDPRDCTPTAGGHGTYSTFYTAVYNTVAGSAALAAKVTDGLPALHVKQGRHVNTDASSHETLIAYGPVIYVLPADHSFSPHTMDSAKGELSVRVVICEQFTQSASASLVTSCDFIDALRQALLQGSDGTGGSSSWTTGGNVRIAVQGPEVIARNQVETTLVITAMVPEAV